MPPQVIKPPKTDKTKTEHRNDPPGKKLLRNVKLVVDYDKLKHPKKLAKTDALPSAIS